MDDENCWVKQEDPSSFHVIGNGDVGVLLLHGFSGTPREMSRIGHYLHAQDITAYAPLLPGHGTSVAEMNRYNWYDWTAAVLNAFDVLAETCSRVFIAGFSMGSLLTLWLAIQGAPAAGLILYSPALKVDDWRIALTPVLKYFVPSISKSKASDLRDRTAKQYLGGFSRYPVAAAAELYKLQRYVLRHIHKVTTPTSVVYSVNDRSIHPQSGQITVTKLSQSSSVEAVVLYGSGHAVVVDAEWEYVAKETYRFIRP